MAGTSLIFPYQWRAFWRAVLRTGRLKFYLTLLLVLGWIAAAALPAALSRAAGELAAGRTAVMDGLLLVLGLLWLLALGEDLNVSLSSERLRRFPLDERSLLALRLSSVFLSPMVWLATVVSLLGLFPLLRARNALVGGLAGFLFFALAIGVGVTVTQPLGAGRWKRRLLVGGVAIGAVAVAVALAANPASLVTTIAVATRPYAMAAPAATLLVSGAAISFLLRWSFRRSLYGGTSERTAHRDRSVARLPGRLGPLILKEQRSLSRVLDVWMVLFVALGVAALSLAAPLSSIYRQTFFVVVFVLNANVTLNCLGRDRPAGLTRYLILPVRGQDLLLAKNVAVMSAVAVQLIALLAIGSWQSGIMQFGAEMMVLLVLVLTHLAWGNVVSVFEPRRTEPHKFSRAGDPVTGLVSMLIGGIPGVAVMALLRSGSRVSAPAIAAIVLLTMAAYYRSLRYAGRTFERRIDIISRRLA